MNKKILAFSLLVIFLCFTMFSQGCAILAVGGLIGWGAAKSQPKELDRLEQELLDLCQDYKDGKIAADTYWNVRAKLVTELESIATQKDIARKEAILKSISNMEINKPEKKIIRDKFGRTIATVDEER